MKAEATIGLLLVISPVLATACSGYNEQESSFKLTADSVKFLFFNSSGAGEPHAVTDIRFLTDDDYDSRRSTVILIHGFGDHYPGSDMIPSLVEAYSSIGNWNIMAVEWRKPAASPFYVSAVKNTFPVGKIVAQFLDRMITQRQHSMELTEIIGFSLGAHVAGVASSFLASKPRRVIGLDPAEPLLKDCPLEYILDKSDAPLVEVIHTSGGYLGFKRPLGHRDFYPNGGLFPQPGCPGDLAGIVCSHDRAFYYLAEAVKNRGRGFEATKCDTMKNYINGSCLEFPKLLMANNNYNLAINGTFFLVTNQQNPYGRNQ